MNKNIWMYCTNLVLARQREDQFVVRFDYYDRFLVYEDGEM